MNKEIFNINTINNHVIEKQNSSNQANNMSEKESNNHGNRKNRIKNDFLNTNAYKNDEVTFINYKLMEQEILNYSEHKFFSDIIKSTKKLSENLKHYVLLIIKTLDSSDIDIDGLGRLAYEGLDESASLRNLVWKVLLGLLPRDINKWEDSLNKKRSDYEEMKRKHLKNNKFLFKRNVHQMKVFNEKESTSIENNDNNTTSKNNIICNIEYNNKENKDNIDENSGNIRSSATNISENSKKQKPQQLKKKLTTDHPLESSSKSQWKNMLNDVDLHGEILKDTKRTRPYMNFFSQSINNNNTNVMSIGTIINNSSNDDNQATGREILTNILFIFSKEHPNLKYSQGMNEILAPLLYCLSTDTNIYFKKFIEADAYYCFCEIIKGLESWYIDNCANVPLKVKEFEYLLRKKDSDIYDLFKKSNIDFQFFIFRWVSLCFSQEYEIPELLRIWDSAFSYCRFKINISSDCNYIVNTTNTIDSNKCCYVNALSHFFILYSLGLLKLNREFLIKAEFSELMSFVQEGVSEINVEKILNFVLMNNSTDSK